MRVYITRTSQYGEDTKQKPTEFIQLIEEKIAYNSKIEHCASKWYTEVNNKERLGELISLLAEKEKQRIVYTRPQDNMHARVMIYDDYIE